MQNEGQLNSLKFIRNVFDTIGVECGIASRAAIDMWAQVLENKEDAHPIGYAKNALHKLDALNSLLYSIKVQAEKIINGDSGNADISSET